MLVSGQSIPEELVTKLTLEKLSSLEVSHLGMFILHIGGCQSSLETCVLSEAQIIPGVAISFVLA